MGVWVALVPDNAHLGEFRLFRQRTTDQYGRFDIGASRLVTTRFSVENKWNKTRGKIRIF